MGGCVMKSLLIKSLLRDVMRVPHANEYFMIHHTVSRDITRLQPDRALGRAARDDNRRRERRAENVKAAARRAVGGWRLSLDLETRHALRRARAAAAAVGGGGGGGARVVVVRERVADERFEHERSAGGLDRSDARAHGAARHERRRRLHEDDGATLHYININIT